MTESISELKNILTSQNLYSSTIPYRKNILSNQNDTIQTVIQALQEIFQTSNQPMQLLMAVKFCKDCIETFNDTFIKTFQSTILPFISQIASFQYQNKDVDRGENYFASAPTKEFKIIGNSLVRLSLECIWVWAKFFPFDPNTKVISQYKIELEKLCKLGVQFNKIQYFKYEEIQNKIPTELIPISLLRMVRAKIELQLIQEGKINRTQDQIRKLTKDSKKKRLDNNYKNYAHLIWKVYLKSKIQGIYPDPQENLHKTQTSDLSDYKKLYQEQLLKIQQLEKENFELKKKLNQFTQSSQFKNGK